MFETTGTWKSLRQADAERTQCLPVSFCRACTLKFIGMRRLLLLGGHFSASTASTFGPCRLAVVVSLGDAAQFALFNRSATSWTIAVRQQLQQLGQGHPLGSGPLGSLLDARNVRQRVGFGRDLRTQSDVPCVIVQRGGPFVRDRER